MRSKMIMLIRYQDGLIVFLSDGIFSLLCDKSWSETLWTDTYNK
jgi:hypothetical protein